MNLPSLLVYAFDISLRSSGWAIYSPGGVKSGCITTKKPGAYALLDIYEEVEEIIRINGRPEVALVEDYTYGQAARGKSTSMTVLAEVQGVVKVLCAKFGSVVVPISLSTWRQIEHFPKVLKKGSVSERDRYIEWAERRYKRSFSTTDEADAVMILSAGIRIMKGESATRTSKGLRSIIFQELGLDM